jgi:uncharacterized protein
MKCPTCPEATLVMTERQGVEIDYCPQCRGVWLDRGELDKLVERAGAVPPPKPVAASANVNPMRRDRPDFVDSDYPSGQGQYGRRKKSWLGEIFD